MRLTKTQTLIVTVCLLTGSVAWRPTATVAQTDPSDTAQINDTLGQQLDAVREQKAYYAQQQGDLQQQAEVTTQGLADLRAQVAKVQAAVEASARHLDQVTTQLTRLKKQRAAAMQSAYMDLKGDSIFYALVDSKSLSEFLSKGQYTDFLIAKKTAGLEDIDTKLQQLEHERHDIVTKRNAYESEITALGQRIADIQSQLSSSQENLEAANRLEAALAGATGNFNHNDRPFLKNNQPIGDRYMFEGGGTEHGLGMSQYGAKGAADRGKNYRDIISHYYVGTTIGQVETFSVAGQGDSEEYVARVVTGEISSSWPMETLKAQAVAARSYAYKNQGSQDCTARTQFCAPSASAQAREAVNATRGQVAMFNGQVISAYFHSTSGGWTENNENVWGGSPIPWLRGVASPWETDSPHWDWKTNSYTRQQMSDILNRDERTAVGDLQTIKIVGRGVSGRVTSLQIIGSRGTKTVSGARFKTVFNVNTPPDERGLRSTMFGFI